MTAPGRAPLRSPANGGGGILGMAPPGPPISMGQPPHAVASSSPPVAAPRVPVGSSSPPPTSTSLQRSRDPRARARDSRKRGSESSAGEPSKRSRTSEEHGGRNSSNSNAGGGAEFDAIAELARHMTPEKLNLLPPNERQIVMVYMQNHGISF
jgi:hypothetical protein